MRTFLLSLGCGFGLLAQAQQIRITPDTTDGGGSLYPLAFQSVGPDRYQIAGYTALGSDGFSEKGYVLECSKTGIIWSKKLNSVFSCNALTSTMDGGLIEFGQKPGLSGLPDACISRWNSVGDTLWTTTLATSAEDIFQTGLEAPDGSIYAAGTRRLGSFFQLVVAKFSSSGLLLWSRQDAGTASGNQIPTDMYWVGNELLVFGQECVGPTQNLFVRKYAPGGTELLHKVVGSSGLNEGVPSVARTSDGGYVFYTGVLSNTKTALLKVDASLSLVPLSSRLLGMPGKFILATSIQADLNDDLYLGGAVIGATGYYASVTKVSAGSVSWTTILNTNGPVAAKVSFEGMYVIAPSIGFSLGTQGVVLSPLSKATGLIMGGPCEALLENFSVVPSAYNDLTETIIPVATMSPTFVQTFGQTIVSYLPEMDDCGMGTLPMHLIAWNAKVDQVVVRLSWTTASEENNAHFTVERSTEGVVFEEVLRVDGAGTSMTERHYEATDEEPRPGVSYYRLRQTDWDGQQSVSDVVVVHFQKSASMSYRRGDSIRTDEPTELADMAGRRVQGVSYDHRFEDVGTFVLRGEATVIKVIVTD
jgi:hypothetical protein